jgi:hypothetical protein
MKVLRWLSERLKDLFYDATNTYLDPGRVASWLALLSILGAAAWNIHLHKEIDLSATGFPAGLAALLTAVIIYIHKDRQRSTGG